MHWRLKRDSCTERREWELIAATAIRQLTYKYKLPHPPAIRAEAKLTRPKDDAAVTPTLALTQLDLQTKPELTMVVDCKSLARVLNGQELLCD